MEYTESHLNQEASQSSWSRLGIHSWVKIGILGILLYLIYSGEIRKIVSMWSDPSWSHGFLIPLFSLYFINKNRDDIIGFKPKPSYFGLFLLVAVLLFYPMNIVHFQFGYFNPLSMVAAVGAIVLFLGGWRLIQKTWLPIVFLFFAIPIPDRYLLILTRHLRVIAAQFATFLLDQFSGLEASLNGVVIDVIHNGQRLEPSLNVAEACSGMRLLMAFVALGVAMAYLHYRPIWQRLVLLAATVPIAIICNIVRVTVTGMIYIFWEPQYAQGIYHDMLGLLMLPLAFSMYGGLAWLMENIFVDEQQEQPDVIVRSSGGQSK